MASKISALWAAVKAVLAGGGKAAR